jgi:hypothetical protein
MGSKKYKPDAIRKYVCSILEGYGVPAKKARITSEELIETETVISPRRDTLLLQTDRTSGKTGRALGLGNVS